VRLICSLWELYYSKLSLDVAPLSAITKAAILYSIVNDAPMNMRSIREGIPIALEATVKKLLEKDSSRRHSSAAELKAELLQFTTEDGKTTQARSQSA